jgi:Tol biopolymer transport system component
METERRILPAALASRVYDAVVMPIESGARLGHYTILAPLGAGGMGEVFVAHDTKLDRKVALKVLPASVAADPDRRERFAREARAVAALNHPNIVTVHSVEEAPSTSSGQVGVHFLTMELVEGRTLADLIPAKGLPLDQLLKFAIPLADAVSAAHARGITHRDLKPANVMVTTDGRVKVLDFGLAKLKEDLSSAGDSMTAMRPQPLTGEGRIVGTVSYMSPEQAEGKPVDHRSDIFSLGVMLYEMATGERPFKGDSSVSTLSSILRDTPRPVTEINPGLPRDLAKIIRRVLTKDPEHRYQTAKDLRNELEELKRELDSGELAAAAAVTPIGRTRTGAMWMWAGAGALVVAVVTAAVWLGMSWLRPGRSASAPLQVTSTARITSAAGIETNPSLSPDGKWIVYASAGDIQLQSVGEQAPFKNLTEGEAAADSQPAFSPDGDSIVFRSERKGGGLFVMGKTGGAAKLLTSRGYDPAWTHDGRFVVFSTQVSSDPDGRLGVSAGLKVEVATHTVTQITAGDFMQPNVSPHADRIAYWALPVTTDVPLRFSGNDRDIWTIRLDGTGAVRVTNDAFTDWNPVWSADGRFLFFASDRGGSMNLWRVAIDEASGRVLGEPEAITTPSPWLGFITRSRDGRLMAYASYDYTRNIARVPFDADRGTVATGPEVAITSGTQDWHWADPSPDGASVVMSSYRRQEDLYVARADATGMWTLTQLTNDRAKDRAPRWSPKNSDQIAFASNRNGAFSFWTINQDGNEARERVSLGRSMIYPVWSPDGSSLMATTPDTAGRHYVFALRDGVVSEPADTLPPDPDPDTAFSAWSWSPDSKKIAGWAGRTSSIWVYSFDTKTYTPIVAGRNPAWLNDGRRLVHASSDGRLFVVDTVTKRPQEILAPRPGETLGEPKLTQDNRFLFYTHATTGADIFLMTIK